MSTKRVFGLIGFPLNHSFSPAYFNQKFARENIADAEYKLFPLASIHDLKGLIESGVCGLNVTIPYKQSVLSYLDDLDDAAKEIGAVNCIHINAAGKTKGFNTDVYGFEMSIKPFLENKYERALIIGTGGSSKAVAHVLRKWNIDHFFLTRTPAHAKHIGTSALKPEMLQHFPLIINCSPLGMAGMHEHQCPIDEASLSGITNAHFVYDLVYNPETTVLLGEASKRGAQTMNGLKMLHLQAEKSWEIWNRPL